MVLPEIGPVEESVPVAKGISMGGAGCVYDSVPRRLQVRGRVDGKVGKGDAVKIENSRGFLPGHFVSIFS